MCGRKRAGRMRGRKRAGRMCGKECAGGKGREEKSGKKRAGNNGREENFITIELELKYITQLTLSYIAQLKIKIHGQIKSQSAELVLECWSDLVILLPSPINIVPVVVVVAAVVVAVVVRPSRLEPRRVGTRGLDVRVAQAGVIAGRDVGHDALESPAAPPQPTAGLVEVRRRRAVLLMPGERPLTPIDEEGVPSRAVVGIPAGIPPLLRRELEVVVVRDGRLARHT